MTMSTKILLYPYCISTVIKYSKSENAENVWKDSEVIK